MTDPRGWGLGPALVILAAALGAQAGAAAALRALWPEWELTLLAGCANLLALTAVSALGFAAARRGPRWRPRPDLVPWVGAALVLTSAGGTVVLAEVSNFTIWLAPLPEALARLFDGLSGAPTLVSLFTLALVAPLTEELLFRGLLLPGFVRRYGTAPGLVLSSALFALFHLNLWQALPAFAAGLYLGWLALATGSLLYPMAAHALFNGLPVILTSLGLVINGYNTPASEGWVGFQPPLFAAAGAALMAAGLGLTRRWAPLSPSRVSDTVGP